ncbi:MAG: aspartate ammonia-lyase [Anaeromusa sp.]|uniref:aspartate ammonia-lyase n=1 Tax=Anaeromusa sp. TaxID=1872520 RepID=UPI002B1F7771|nr:aspartate ammonia-lyase [Anaeromusa sp.]MEA4834754.1 aspartate ammonia-lyase [Anaeromusa sp.]
MRVEHDCIGEMGIADELYYGIQTERARQNFPVSNTTYEAYPIFLNSIALLKMAAAKANEEIGALPSDIACAICQAAEEIIAGKHKGMFPIDVFSGGTSVNMNTNEVIANRANEILTGRKGYEKVHPNTHVNMGQSTNDVIPAAIEISCYYYFQDLISELECLSNALAEKTKEFNDVVKIARTCLQDAVPITLGQEFSGYYTLIERQVRFCKKAQEACTQLSFGGSAVGTCIGTYPGYLEAVYRHLESISKIPVKCRENIIDGYQNDDGFLLVSATLKSVATGISKISRDFRLMSSGPRAGFNEIRLPSLQPGSSIMPGKINPVIPELMNHICYQVCGNDVAVTMAVEAGELDLNVWDAPLRKCIQESFVLLTNGLKLFTSKCVEGITANREVCRSYAENSLANATVLSAIFGYEKGTAIVKEAYENNESIKVTAVRNKLLTKEDAEIVLDPMVLTDQKKCSEIVEKYKKSLTK